MRGFSKSRFSTYTDFVHNLHPDPKKRSGLRLIFAAGVLTVGLTAVLSQEREEKTSKLDFLSKEWERIIESFYPDEPEVFLFFFFLFFLVFLIFAV